MVQHLPGIPHAGIPDIHGNQDNYTIHDNEGGLGIPTQPFPRAETLVALHVKCPLLLSDCNQKWNEKINVSETPQHQCVTSAFVVEPRRTSSLKYV
jgi:hypothetical protein